MAISQVAFAVTLTVALLWTADVEGVVFGKEHYSVDLPHAPVEAAVLYQQSVTVSQAATTGSKSHAHAGAHAGAHAESKAVATAGSQHPMDPFDQLFPYPVHTHNQFRPAGWHLEDDAELPIVGDDVEFNQDIDPLTEGWLLFMFDDFEDHAFPHWSNPHITTCGAVTTLGGYGTFNGPQGEVWSHITSLPKHSHVRIKAELFFIDNWEWEFFYLKIDDRAVFSKTCPQCGRKGRNFCANHRFCDTLAAHIDVTVPHKNDLVRITWGSSSAKRSLEMTWGISNLQVFLRVACAPGGASADFDSHGYRGAKAWVRMEGQPVCTGAPPFGGVAIMIPAVTGGGGGFGGGGACKCRDWPGLHCRWCRDIGVSGKCWISPKGPKSQAYETNCGGGGGGGGGSGSPSGAGGPAGAAVAPGSAGPAGAAPMVAGAGAGDGPGGGGDQGGGGGCDEIGSADGGGWTPFVLYKKQPQKNPAKSNAVPMAPPSNGGGHKSLKEMGLSMDQVSEIQFCCTTNMHGRTIHFKTINEDILRSAHEWDQDLFRPEDWRNGWKPMGGHSAHLPASTTNSYRDKHGGFFEFPFYTSGQYHWAIKGGGSRWECDDYSIMAGATEHAVAAR